MRYPWVAASQPRKLRPAWPVAGGQPSASHWQSSGGCGGQPVSPPVEVEAAPTPSTNAGAVNTGRPAESRAWTKGGRGLSHWCEGSFRGPVNACVPPPPWKTTTARLLVAHEAALAEARAWTPPPPAAAADDVSSAARTREAAAAADARASLDRLSCATSGAVAPARPAAAGAERAACKRGAGGERGGRVGGPPTGAEEKKKRVKKARIAWANDSEFSSRRWAPNYIHLGAQRRLS